MIRRIQATDGVWLNEESAMNPADDASVAGPTRLQGNSGNDLH